LELALFAHRNFFGVIDEEGNVAELRRRNDSIYEREHAHVAELNWQDAYPITTQGELDEAFFTRFRDTDREARRRDEVRDGISPRIVGIDDEHALGGP
jgi:hypothetical protein